jgi:hypothetical protein
MNRVEKKVQQRDQQKKFKGNPAESKPAPVATSAPVAASASSSTVFDPTIDMFNDSTGYERPENKSSSVKIEPAACMPNVFQQTSGNQRQLGPQGAASMPDVRQMANGAQCQHIDNMAGTVNWLLREGVSLTDLGSVLDIYNDQQKSQARSMTMQQLPMPQAAPQQPVSNDSNQSPADFAEDVISLFGKPRPPSEISFTNDQFNHQPMNIYSRRQAEDYSNRELFQSICFGQDSFLSEAV